MSKETLYSTDRFNVVKNDDKFGIEPSSLYVAILPFSRDKMGLPGQLGVLNEYNHIRSSWGITVITGKAEGEDPDILAAAQRRMLNRSGIDVQEPERWYYLGFLTTHKMINEEIICFACDITGLSKKEEDPEDVDPEEAEAESKKDPKDKAPEFIMMGVNQALDTKDCFVPAIFMKIFKYVFGFNNTGDATANAANNPMQKEIMDIDNVIGVGATEDGWLVHIEKGSDKTAIESRVRAIVGEEASIKIEESDPIVLQQQTE